MTHDLTDEDLKRMWAQHAPNVGGIFDYARAVIEADRALRVPMTDAQIAHVANKHVTFGWLDDYVAGVESVIRAAEAFHGIKT